VQPSPNRREPKQPSQTADPKHNPYLFVVGCPRSGTTLLQRMLDSHPRLAVANDTHFIPRALEKTAPRAMDEVLRQGDVPLTPDLVEGVRRYHRFGRLGIDEQAFERSAAASSTYREFVGRLYAELASRRGKPKAGEKTPDYVRHLPFLHALFPWAKTIHIIRDGRDTALSLLDWATGQKGPGRLALWRKDPLAAAALWWRWQVKSGREAGRRLGPAHYLEVRYERLVDRPVQELANIAAFLNVPFAVQMLTYHHGRTRYEEGLSAKSAWLPPTSGLRDWRTQMAPENVELFEALAGDLLAELGYPASARAISPSEADRAEACRQWWNDEMSRRKPSTRVPPAA